LKSIVKDVAALRKKTGSKESFTVWDSLTGPRSTRGLYNAKWKEMDEMDPAGRFRSRVYGLFARLTDATESLEFGSTSCSPI